MPAFAFAEAGEGMKSGNYSVTAGATVSGGYDSNIFYESKEETEDLSTAPLLLFRPFLGVSTIDPGGFDLKLDVDLVWRQYLSDLDTINGQSGLSAGVNGQVAFNRAGSFSLALDDSFTRTNEPPASPTEDAYNRIQNSAGATVGVHPGGHVFQHYLSYNWLLYRHGEPIEDLDKMGHEFSLVNYWRFLPKTALILTGSYGLLQYDQAERAGSSLTNIDSSSLRVTGGLTGLVTNRISTRIVGGYGWAFYDSGPSFDGLLLDLKLTWRVGSLSSGSKLYVGYDQGFQDSTVSSFYTYLRPYAGVELGLFRARLHLGFEFDTSFRSYAGTPPSDGTVTNPEELSDALVTASAFGTFNIYKWWSLDLRYSLAGNFTDDVVLDADFGSEALRDYIRHSVTFGTTIRY